MKPRVRIDLSKADQVWRFYRVLRKYGLNTICELDRCPNLYECWVEGSVTFAIMGRVCTRACPFCPIERGGVGEPLDPGEPERLARAVRDLGLRHVVISSVTRDDLPDGGASHFAETVRAIRRLNPSTVIEVLIPDFGGDREAVKRVVEARPHIIGHNIETVRRLHRRIKPGGDYDTSLRILKWVKEMSREVLTKSSIILGFGEGLDEVIETMRDLRGVGVDIVVIGGYAKPLEKRGLAPKEVDVNVYRLLRDAGRRLGFRLVEASPRARSSYLSSRMIEEIIGKTS